MTDDSNDAAKPTKDRHRSVAFVAVAMTVLSLGACKSREAAPAPPPKQVSAPAHVDSTPTPKSEPSTFKLPPEHTFELPDDAPIDPAEEDHALRHNCCDEMPPAEVEAATRAK